VLFDSIELIQVQATLAQSVVSRPLWMEGSELGDYLLFVFAMKVA
jgi:hypothetical protein